jgi:hypothetical protein
VKFTVTLSERVNAPVTVGYAPYSAPGCAEFPADFEAGTGTLTFLPGETTKTLPMIVKGDTLDENDETALVAFTNPTNAAIGGYGVGGVNIVVDD